MQTKNNNTKQTLWMSKRQISKATIAGKNRSRMILKGNISVLLLKNSYRRSKFKLLDQKLILRIYHEVTKIISEILISAESSQKEGLKNKLVDSLKNGPFQEMSQNPSSSQV